jgi:hypothetical protein
MSQKNQDPLYLEHKSPLCGRPASGCKARDDECDDDDGSQVSPPPQNVSNPPKGASPPAHNKTTEASEPPKDTSPPKTTDDKPPSKPEPSTTTSSSTTSTSPSPTPTHNNGSGGGGGENGPFTGMYVSFVTVLIDHQSSCPSATFYYQKGNAGSCEKVHSDDDFVIALRECSLKANSINLTLVKDPAMDPAKHCGRSVKITNVKDRSKTATAICADTCPTCTDSKNIDLAHRLFNVVVGDDSIGAGSVEWEFL